MINVTGRTFEHKETLKAMGAKWNADKSCWQFYTLTAHERAQINKMVGVGLSDDKDPDDINKSVPISQSDFLKSQPPKTPVKSRLNPSIEDIIAEILDSDDDSDIKPSERERVGSTNFHGDDKRYLGYFADKKPIAFFGFSSLAEQCKYVNAMTPGIERTRWRGWDKATPGWFGSKDMPEAMKLAKHGWPEGVELAEEISELLRGDHAIKRRKQYSVAGGSVSVGRMLAGNPQHMVARPKQPGKKSVTFFIEGFASAVVPADLMVMRAATTAAISDILEMNGYRCEIVSITTGAFGSKPAYQIATTLKAAGETLNLNDLVFSMGHPSNFRRIGFGTLAGDKGLEHVWSGMGSPTSAFGPNHPLAANEFYIKQVPHHKCRMLNSIDDTKEKALALWRLMVGKELPVKLIGENDK